MRLRILACSLLGLSVLVPARAADRGVAWNDPVAGNPVLPGYFADPCIRKFGDTYYIYATPDGWDVGKGPFCIWTSRDFVHWTSHESKWPSTDFKWAPSVVQKGGKYYMYNSVPCQVWAAVSDSPLGPWTNLMPEGPFIPDQTPKGTITLDGEVFIDDDGQAYLYYGTWGTFTAVKLGDDMRSFKEPPVQYFGEAGKTNSVAPEWFEAPYMFKRNGVYYLMYSSEMCQDHTYKVRYCTAKSPMGPWTYEAEKNPILPTNADDTVDGPGHHTILEDGGKVYIVYHRHDNPHHPDGAHRQTCIDELHFLPDGTIEKVVPSHSGVGYLAPSIKRDTNLALGGLATASSSAGPDFAPAYAADENNGTLWKASSYTYPQWLQVDLGKARRVRRIETEFQFAQVPYEYRIETSIDGKAWNLFADRSSNGSWGPMTDPGDATARYFRITLLGDRAPSRPQPEVGIWGFKLYDGVVKANAAPTVDCGPPLTGSIDFPTRTLDARVLDDGLPNGPVSVRWSQVSGPGTVSFLHGDRVNTPATFPSAGTYVLKLAASDGELTGTGTVECRISAPKELVASYDFDETGGSLAMDASGNGQDAPVRIGAGRSPGVRGGAVNFATADYAGLPVLGRRQAITFAAWVNPHTLNADRSALLSGGAVLALRRTGELEFSAASIPAQASSFRFGPETLGRWRHVAVTCDMTAGKVSFFVDGKLDVSREVPVGSPLDLSLPGRLGGPSTGLAGFDGELDEVRLYGAALPAARVAALAKPVSFTSVAAARKLRDGESVRLISKVVTFAPKDVMTFQRTTDDFYLAEPDGSAGVSVLAPSGSSNRVREDSAISLTGVMRTAANGERYVEVSGAPGVGAPSSPVSFETSVAGLGAATTNRLVTVTGTASAVEPDGTAFTLTGSAGGAARVVRDPGGFRVRVAPGYHVSVTGVVSAFGQDGATIRPKNLTVLEPKPNPLLASFRFEKDGQPGADSSGNGNDARPFGTLKPADGKSGGAVAFDGRASLQLPDLGMFEGFTLACWVSLDNLGTDDFASSLLHCDGWDFGDVHFMIQRADGLVQGCVNGAAPGNLVSKTSFKDAPDRWVHVAFSYDSRARTMALYVNGRLEASANCWETRPVSLSGARIGSWGDSSRMLHGRLSDFRVYQTALTAEEIAALAD